MNNYTECGGCGNLYNLAITVEVEQYNNHDCNDTDSQDCGHERIECPSHEGNWDCNPFCRLCEGDQEYCPTCDAHEHEWDTTTEKTHCLGCGVVE